MTFLHSHKLLHFRLLVSKLTTRVPSQALKWETIFFYLYGFFPHWAHADSSFVGASVVSRLDMYRTYVLLYRTYVLLARPTKVRR